MQYNVIDHLQVTLPLWTMQIYIFFVNDVKLRELVWQRIYFDDMCS